MKPCIHCGEVIKEGEGTAMPGGEFHVECFWRGVLGSVGHIQKRCSCYGGNENDPPGMTLREAAKAAVLEYAKSLDAQSKRVVSMSYFDRVRRCFFDAIAPAAPSGGDAGLGDGAGPAAPPDGDGHK